MTEFTSEEFRGMIPKLKKQRKQKYNARSCRCNLGEVHASRGEAQCCEMLHAIYPKAEIISQPRYILYVEGVKVGTHVPDWKIIHKDGREEVHEFKGMPTDLWKLKYKIFKAVYPHIFYKVWYQKDLS